MAACAAACVAACAAAGIGFTVSLFITGLAFDDPAMQDSAKIGVLSASILAAGLGATVLRRAAAESTTDAPAIESIDEDDTVLA